MVLNVRNPLLVCLTAAILLAGCMATDLNGDTPGNGNGVEPSLLLADFADCDLVYPDNQTVPCEDQFTEVEVVVMDMPRQTDGWICIFDGLSTSGTNHYILWEPETDRLGLYYWGMPGDRPISGYITISDYDTADWVEGRVFHGGGPSGFMILGDHPGQYSVDDLPWPRDTWFRMRFYDHTYETNTTALQGGEIRALWSWYHATPYPIQQFTTANETYYFGNTTVHESASGDYRDYGIENFHLVGGDFDIRVTSNRVYEKTHTASLSPGISCQT